MLVVRLKVQVVAEAEMPSNVQAQMSTSRSYVVWPRVGAEDLLKKNINL